MNSEKTTVASSEMVSISAGICRKMLANAASRMTIMPTKSQRPMSEKSRLETVAMVAMAPKMTAVLPKAIMTSEAPLLMPSTKPSRRESISPMKKVKPSSSRMPALLLR